MKRRFPGRFLACAIGLSLEGIFFVGAMVAFVLGLVLLTGDRQVAIAALVASVALAILGLAAAQEENHRELLEQMERYQ